MNRTKGCLAALCMLLLAGFLAAAEKPLGSWDCVTITPDGGENKWTLTLREQDGKLAGMAGNGEGEVEIENVKFENDTLTFNIVLDSGTIEMTMKFTGDKAEGTWKNSGQTGPVKGARKA